MRDLLKISCPRCRSEALQQHTTYQTLHHGQRIVYLCTQCGEYFSETATTFMAGIRKPLSLIIHVVNSRTEGMGLNACARVYGISKNTILDWERRFANLRKVLFLYSLVHQFLNLVIEGDEVYTKVNDNKPPDESLGWTVVLMDRSSRFLWELQCGKKDKKLFKKAISKLSDIIEQTQDLTLLTDGERRYGNILFDICYELIYNGKRGRPRKTYKRGVKVRIKNKGSQSKKKGRKRKKYEQPHAEHPDNDIDIDDSEIHANHCESFNSSLRRRCSAYNRKSNTYSKSEAGLQRVLDMYWVVHNFLRRHFTTKQVPALSMGVLDRELSYKELFMIPVP